jgi:four helix bundle protein
VSIESNISERCERNGDFGRSTFAGNPQITPSEFSRFLDIAQGSACEVKCQILIARDLGYLDHNKSQLLTDKINEISRMINSLSQKLKPLDTTCLPDRFCSSSRRSHIDAFSPHKHNLEPHRG